MNNARQQPQPPQALPPAPQALVPVETSSHAMALVPSSLDGAYQLAGWLASAQLIAPNLKGKQADIFTILLAGAELGLPPMAALRGLYVVNGKPALESRTKAAICLQRGAALYITRVEYTPEATTWETLRRGQTEPVRSRYTRQEAKAAGLLDKEGPWRNYSQRMISHRALGWLCDDVYPDIVLGVATAEDFFDDADQISFKPIGAGLELGAAGPPPPKPAPVVIPGVPATAKPANPPPAAGDAPPAPRVITAEEVVELVAAMKKCTTIKELRALAAERIAGIPEGGLLAAVRVELVEAYEAQRALILEAAKTERGDGQ